MYCSRCSSYQCECEDYPIEIEIRDLRNSIQSLEQEVARLREENFKMRSWKNCKHDINSFCISSEEEIAKPCPCDKWEIRK